MDGMMIDGKLYKDEKVNIELTIEDYAHLESSFKKMIKQDNFEELELYTISYLVRDLKDKLKFEIIKSDDLLEKEKIWQSTEIS